MAKEEIEKAINEACSFLYRDAKHLLDEGANERDIVSYIVPLLRGKYCEYQVDSEYNREGAIGHRIPKTDSDGNRIIPDIVVHKHGPEGQNLVAIEVKGYWNHEPRQQDEDLLRRLQVKHNYKYLYRLELGKDCAELIPVHRS